jgi:hypothetical protein
MNSINFFKNISSGDYIIIMIIFVGVILLVSYFSNEGLENVTGEDRTENEDNSESQQQELAQPQQVPEQESGPQPLPSSDEDLDKVAVGSDEISPEELLPKYDEADEFVKQNPVSKLLKEQNFLISGHHVGINTVMQSNKIPYHDLRSAPPIPKESVGPWSQSSYEQPAGSNRRKLEVGYA